MLLIPPTAVLRSEAKLSPSKARVEHRRRQDRLEQIRPDLASQTVSKGKGEAYTKHSSTSLGDEEEKTVSISTNYPQVPPLVKSAFVLQELRVVCS